MAERLIYPAPALGARLALREEPQAAPLMYQTWAKLLFLHWEWDASEIQRTLPEGLFVDTHGGKAYLGVTPFFMEDVRASFLPPIPGTSDFLELNVRTYVYDRNGQAGAWFYSLDCNQALAVILAKIFFSLPYKSAEMSARERSGMLEYTCHRAGSNPHEKAEFHYSQSDETVGSGPGSLGFFLVERYLLFAYSRSTEKIYTARVHHAPYQLFRAEVGRCDDSMLRLNGFDPRLRAPDYQWMAAPVRVKVYGLKEAGNAGG